MKKYELYGLIIESDIEFIQLTSVDNYIFDKDDVITVKRNDIISSVNKGLEEEPENYKVGFEVSYLRNKWGYYLVKEGKDIFYELKENASIDDIKPFILGYCVSMALLQREIIAIHCSAVCRPKESVNDGAILITGESGAGKSTITRKLLEQGYRLMADDVAAIRKEECTLVYPAFPYQKLCRNEVEKRNLDMDELIYIGEDKDKFLVPVKDSFVSEPQKLKCMIYLVISNETEVTVEKLKGLMQLMVFKHNLFLHRLDGEWEKNPKLLNLCLGIAGECPVYIITRPDGKDTIDEIVDHIKNIEK